MASGFSWRVGIRWWVAWIVVCVPAGAAAGWGFVEFLPEFPSGGYDGGFVGDLFLFGGMMALAQAPFIGVFGWSTIQNKNLPAVLAGLFLALCWTLAGFVGWTSGAIVELWLGTPYYSGPTLVEALGRSVRWLVMGALEGFVFAAACVLDTRGSSSNVVVPRRILFGLTAAWAVASAAGGFLFEAWASFDSAYGGESRLGAGSLISGIARDLGAAPNVADIVVPYAVMLPVLYGLLTGGVVFAAVLRLRRVRNSP